MVTKEDRALNLSLRLIFPGGGDPAEDLIAFLTEIKDARANNVLTATEFEGWPEYVRKQIVERAYVPLSWRVTLALFFPASLSLVVYGIVGREGSCVAFGAGTLLMDVYMWYRLERHARARRRLGRDARLSVIERLVQGGVVSETEGVELRSAVIAAFPADTGT